MLPLETESKISVHTGAYIIRTRYSKRSILVHYIYKRIDFPILADYAVIPLNNRIIYATHGHIYNCGNLPPLCNGDILLNGHTHIPKCVENESFIYMNPGSVSIPKENSAHSYMTLENGVFIWKNLENGEAYNSFRI